MDKFITFFRGICICIFCISCSSDYNSDSNNIDELFLFKLKEQYIKAESIISGSSTRLESKSLCYSDVISMADKVDNCMLSFKEEHKNLLKRFASNDKLSEDEMLIICMDESLLHNFINEKFSHTAQKYIYNCLDNNPGYSIEDIISNKSLNPLEATILSDLLILNSLKNATTSAFGINRLDSKTRLAAMDGTCEDDFDRDMVDCGAFAVGSYIVSMFWASPVGAFASTGLVYAECVYTSKKNYDRCVRDSQ